MINNNQRSMTCRAFRILLFLSVLFALCAPVFSAPAPKPIVSSLGNLRLMGRFDFSEPDGPICAFSGSSVAVRFKGPEIALRIRPLGNTNNWLSIVLDGRTLNKLSVKKGALVTLAKDLGPEEHNIEVIKRTEAGEGELQFLCFELPKGGIFLEKPPTPGRRIEFIGDSITCGYGNEAKSQNDKYKQEEENFCLTYAYLASVGLGADYRVIAQSGIGVYSNYGGSGYFPTMPDFYKRILPYRWDSVYSDPAWIPDAVVVNLGTNDFSIGIDGKDYEAAYAAFVRGIRSVYPKAVILCTMISDQKSVPFIRSMVKKLNEAGDPGVRTLFYAPVNMARDGLGADWHPSAKTHAVMAKELMAKLRKLLEW